MTNDDYIKELKITLTNTTQTLNLCHIENDKSTQPFELPVPDW